MAKRSKSQLPKRRFSLDTWLLRHAQTALSALGRLWRTPINTLMTTMVIGIALALPSSLHLLIGNMRVLSDAWEGSASVSLFLAESVDEAQAKAVRARIIQRPDVVEARLISRGHALEEFRRLSGFGGAIDLLDHNPLPAVVVVRPHQRIQGAAAVKRMADTLQTYREIDLAQVDLQWVQRLSAITRMIERGVWVLAVLLAVAVLLIVGNTIRLEVQNRRSEIEIVTLVGGTDAFIRRPFLYEGLWYGALGATLGLLLVLVSLYLLNGPVRALAGLYESTFALSMIDLKGLLGLLIGGPLLGLAGAWLAVGRHLARTRPA